MEIDEPDLVDTETEDTEVSNSSYSTTVANQNNDPDRLSTPLPSMSLLSSSDTKIPGFNPFSNLTILKKGTFHEWKAKTITALSAARLGSFVLSDQTPPTDPTKLEEYTVRNFQALSVIQTTVDSENFQLVANARTAREAFKSILAQYDDSGGLSTAMIFLDLVSLPSKKTAISHLTSTDSAPSTTSCQATCSVHRTSKYLRPLLLYSC